MICRVGNALPLVVAGVWLAGCSLVMPSVAPPIPAGAPPAVPGSVGSLKWANSPGISDVLQALPPSASATSMLIAATERIREARPGEEIRFGWFVAPAQDAAAAWVLLTGMPDDAIAGEVLRLAFDGAGGSWRVASVESSIHCRRAVDVARQLCV